MADPPLRYDLDGKVAILHLDDGKANALGPTLIQAIVDSLDRAAEEARSVLLVGRPGRFSAGFDLTVMRQGADAARGLVTAGAEMLLKLYVHPQPVVCACTGHAIAAGALTVLAADTRLGAAGDFRIGLNEVAIGMSLPTFGTEIARDRLSKRHFTEATIQARLYDPASAVDAGFLDRLCTPDELIDDALAASRRLAELDPGAYRNTKLRARGALVDEIRSTLEEDMVRVTGPAS